MSGHTILLLEDDDRRIARFMHDLSHMAVFHTDCVAGAIELLKQKKFDLAFLDHDLEFGKRVNIDSADPNTGYHVAKYIFEHFPEMPVVVHSLNWFGGNKIVKDFPNAVYVPYTAQFVPEDLVRLFLEFRLDLGLRDLAGFTEPPRKGS